LWEEDEIDEEIDAKTYGNVLHEVLKILFEPFINSVLRIEDLEGMRKNSKAILKDIFTREYKVSDINYGKNLLKVRIAEIMLDEFLKSEINDISKNKRKIVLKELEEWKRSSIEIEDPVENSKVLRINLKGKIDRIDFYDEIIRIIDYKSGKLVPYDLKIKDPDALITDQRYSMAFQLLMYSYMMWKTDDETGRKINSGVYSLKDSKSGLNKVHLLEETDFNAETATLFEDLLKRLILRIFDKKLPFEQTPDISRCEYCDYMNICNRWKPRT